jgi:predicted nucleic acid-binding protein
VILLDTNVVSQSMKPGDERNVRDFEGLGVPLVDPFSQ